MDFPKRFPFALNLGTHTGLVAGLTNEASCIDTWVQTDLSPAMIGSASGLCVAADEEFLPFAEASFDLVMSTGSLHWVNDLPGALIQMHRVLKPGGLLLVNLVGGETLKELRQSFEQAEIAMSGGLSPRISPFVEVKAAGSLLQRAGFMEPVTDSETLTVSYDDPMKLLYDLRGMGEANALLASAKGFTRRSFFHSAMEYYRKHFSDEHGRVPATFDLITLTAWKKDE